ncbi:MAG: rhodanese-like domain-containing protein [Nanoarchaeota archaeon]
MLVDVTAEKAKELLDGNHDIIVVDVRTKSENKQERICDGLNIDFYSENFEGQISKLSKNKKYFLYCRTGSRSSYVLQMMKNLGFTNVYHLKTGIMGWKNKGFSVKSGS